MATDSRTTNPLPYSYKTAESPTALRCLFFHETFGILIRLFVSLQAKKQKKGIMRVGDNVLISPDVTHKSDWQIATVIEVEENPFVGTVISAKTEDGEIFFDKAYLFKPAS